VENLSVQVVKGEPVKDGCIPLRWSMSERDVLTCKLTSSSTGNGASLSLTACPDDMQRYLEQVAQCKSVRTITLGEVKAVPECSDDLQVCTVASIPMTRHVFRVVMCCVPEAILVTWYSKATTTCSLQ
jgi:hypothetical protein